MATVATPTTHELTKDVFGEKLEKLPFEMTIGAELIPFKSAQKLGDEFIFPVTLTMEHGVTYNGTAGGEVTLLDPVSATIKQAKVPAYETILRARIAYRLMKDAMAAGPAAFASATETVLENLQDTGEFRREHSIWYGQMGLGKVATAVGGGVFTISDDTWSAATWEALEGAVLEAWTGTTASETQHNGDLTVSAVDLENKQVTVTGTSAAVVAGDYFYFKGARTASAFNEMQGIMKLMTTTSGTVHNISTTTYSRWRPNLSSSFGVPTFAGYMATISKLTARRIKKTKTNLVIPPKAFEKVANDLMQARRLDGSYSRSTNVTGTENIEFIGQTGMAELIPNAMIRDGDSCAFTGNNGFRVGSTDLTFDIGPNGATDIWFHIQDKNVMEVRAMLIQQPFFFRPSHTIGITGLTY